MRDPISAALGGIRRRRRMRSWRRDFSMYRDRGRRWKTARQWCIAVLSNGGMAGLALNTHGWEMWGWPWLPWLLGLLAQPFWLVETWRARQWGMFATALVFTGSWGLGLWGALL